MNAIVGATDADFADRCELVRGRVAEVCGDAAAEAMMAVNDNPYSATGTPERVVERLTKLRDLGCDYVICYFPEAAYDRSGIELFEQQVIPALSDARN